MTSGLETEWAYSGRKERHRQVRKQRKRAREGKVKSKTLSRRRKVGKWMGKGERGLPRAHTEWACGEQLLGNFLV